MSLLAFENVSKSYGATPALKMFLLTFQLEKLSAFLGQTAQEKQP
ncbi:hypothetical protein D063_07466 [Streptococcus pneumoniae 3051]|nr:hypothetical protein D063_07466 [Streptococcus pneumoniae 3051]